MPHPLAERARSLFALVDAEASAAEAATTMSTPVADALREGGFFSALVPREYGGAEVDVPTMIEIVEEISYADGSAGWSLIANAYTNAFAASFTRDDCAKALFGSGQHAITAGMLGPVGRAVPDGGGYVVTGRYQFGSGCAHTTHLGAGAVVMRDGAPVLTAAGAPELRVAFVARPHVQMLGNWDVLGLIATGSYDYSIDGQHVSESWTFPLTSPTVHRGGPTYHIGVIGLTVSGHAGVAIGIGRRALDELAQLSVGKQRMGHTAPIADHQHFQHEFAHHDAAMRAARLLQYDEFGRAQDIVNRGDALSNVQIQRLRQANTYVTKVACDVARFAYLWAGTNALRNGSVIQRCFRDAHATTQHIVVDRSTYTDTTKALLGR